MSGAKRRAVIRFTEARGFVLRWYGVDGTKQEYFAGGAKRFVESQREALRFKTRDEARAACPKYALYGECGPDDTSGFKVCEIVKTTLQPVKK